MTAHVELFKAETIEQVVLLQSAFFDKINESNFICRVTFSHQMQIGEVDKKTISIVGSQPAVKYSWVIITYYQLLKR